MAKVTENVANPEKLLDRLEELLNFLDMYPKSQFAPIFWKEVNGLIDTLRDCF